MRYARDLEKQITGMARQRGKTHTQTHSITNENWKFHSYQRDKVFTGRQLRNWGIFMGMLQIGVYATLDKKRNILHRLEKKNTYQNLALGLSRNKIPSSCRMNEVFA